MPDWSYQTVFRPLLFRLPPRTARTLTLGAMGALSRMPGGAFVIRTLGHMEPSPLLESRTQGVLLRTPVGLCGGLDPEGAAQRALAQFGFGFLEVGPITYQPHRSGGTIQREAATETIVYAASGEPIGLDDACERIRGCRHKVPIMARIRLEPELSHEETGARLAQLLAPLRAAGSAGFYLDVLDMRDVRDVEASDTAGSDNEAALRALQRLRRVEAVLAELASAWGEAPSFYLYLAPDWPLAQLEALLQSGLDPIWAGAVIGDGIREGDRLRVGPEAKQPALARIRLIRELGRPDLTVKAAAGVHEPADALELLAAGADYVLLHSGLVFAGPGLAKRVNEAIIYEKVKAEPPPEPVSFWKHWGWMCLLGIGMMLGGVIAWMVAATSVLLPYDEAFLGMSGSELDRINEHLLHFMSHDRITLAGTMLSIGILYYQLGKHGLQYGLHWSKTALLLSGGVGFSSFFLYLGYGYFDPLHAVMAALLLPMFLLAMRGNPDQPYRLPVNMKNDRAWRLAQWGQLCFVVLGFSLAIGGITIAAVGVTYVFVPEDLAFMQTTAAELAAANPRLLPLIAHDRAGFGGALLSDALALTVLALWGLQQGARWQWWTLLLGGAPAFLAGLGVHLDIGYTDLWHLSPAIFAFGLYVAGLVLLYPYLMRPGTMTATSRRAVSS
ncbi:hypothetical protein [Paenibacillus sp. YYML68]|uniref:hypothetical protein n=1 Tax=Paenibacillus sp. YYML68 TaxID=2909250 RepID=UPI002493CE3B|nr:hypothetical protein [Paenibacillus sp. YYML68]